MPRHPFAPVAAVSAVAGGLALLGASLGGIASVDRQLATAAPAGGAAATAAAERDGGSSIVDARYGVRAPASRPFGAHRRGAGIRVLQLVQEGRGTLIVLVAPPQARPFEHPRGAI